MKRELTLFKVLPGGPLKVSGPFQIIGPHGEVIESKQPVYLCRCGHSSQKPFCDDSHKCNSFSE